MASSDFCGFSFNGYHSSDLGFLRVSNGSRYNDNLIPTFQDRTVQVPGGDGTYFFDSFYTNKSFSINIAFDSMTEAQFRRLRQIFNAKDVGDLIFDEAPYKAYTAKVQSPPQLNYICFDEKDQRIYKGEGTIQFICYYPYARSVHKYMTDYTNSTNSSEWREASGLLQAKGTYDSSNKTTIYLYNPGDIEADFLAYYTFNNGSCPVSKVALQNNNTQTNAIFFSAPMSALDSRDAYIRVNSKTNLVEGCDSSKELTGTLYNAYITSGDFFKIPVYTGSSLKFVSTGESCANIDYDYLYY